MTLPLAPPIEPMLAKSGKGELPEGDGWIYEPKWDGFRAIVFIDGDEVELQSRNGKSLTRYFPELRFPTARLVLDGEIIIAGPDGVPQFGVLQERIHPAASRIERLSTETPASFVCFDVLAVGDEILFDRPFRERRAILESLDGVTPTRATTDPDEARRWLTEIEGVIAKEADAPYRPGKRLGMVKAKAIRTLDCVVIGYRDGTEPGTVGSLILGQYADDGRLIPIGHSSGFSAKRKRELIDIVAPYDTGEQSQPEPNRWSGDRETVWHALRPELVVEVAYDHASDGRIRHGARLLRFRDDKAPRDCALGIDA